MHSFVQTKLYSKPNQELFGKEHADSPKRAQQAASYLEVLFWQVNNKMENKHLLAELNFYGVLDLVTLSGISYERSIKKTSIEGQFHFSLHKQQYS